MEIQDPENDRSLSLVGLGLTTAEAAELRDKLATLVDHPFPGRHEHVSSEDFQIELSVWIADSEREPGPAA